MQSLQTLCPGSPHISMDTRARRYAHTHTHVRVQTHSFTRTGKHTCTHPHRRARVCTPRTHARAKHTRSAHQPAVRHHRAAVDTRGKTARRGEANIRTSAERVPRTPTRWCSSPARGQGQRFVLPCNAPSHSPAVEWWINNPR